MKGNVFSDCLFSSLEYAPTGVDTIESGTGVEKENGSITFPKAVTIHLETGLTTSESEVKLTISLFH